jgi:hypothetical protein
LLGVVVFIELLDFVPGGRLRDASSGDSTGKIAVQRSDRAMTLQNMRENGAWSLAIQPPNPTGAVAFFEKRQNSERSAATICNYSRLRSHRAGKAIIGGKGGPDLAGWGHGGEAGTGSWERAGPSLLPWAAETPHKVVNTINGAALVGGPFFWPPLDRTSCASERGYCSAGATVFRSAVALALAPVPFAYPGGWGLNPSGCSSPDILRSPPNRAAQMAPPAASRNRA